MNSRVGIIGTGLIGASVGLAAKSAGYTTFGWDADDAHGAHALAIGAIEATVPRDQLCERCDIVVLALPVNATIAELQRLRNIGVGDALVVDVASVKQPIVRAAAGIETFVATHPMAGGASRGPSEASATMFRDRPWIIVPSANAAATERARAFVCELGATPHMADAGEHDRLVTLTSHMPQLLAFAFARELERRFGRERARPFCGPVARELLRIANSDEALWREIFDYNGEQIGEMLDGVTASAHALLHDT